MRNSNFIRVFIKLIITVFLFCIIKPCLSQNEKEEKNEVQQEIITDLRKVKTYKEMREFIKNNAPGEDAFIGVHRMAKPYLDKNDWSGAINVFEEYKSLFPNMRRRFEKIISLLQAPEEELVVNKLDMTINTEKYREYCPVPSLDGKKLYFCRNDFPEGLGGEDIYVSEFINQKWQQAKNIGNEINSESHEAPLNISADGNTLVLFGNYSGSLGSGDLFFTEKVSSGWSEVKHFSSPINSKYWDADGFFTSDGKAFIFASDRIGGIGDYHEKDDYYHGSYWGNIDIYVSLKTNEGWSEPLNPGSIINTPYCERFPFLHPDGKTLYFSSSGHYGLGDIDVFKSVRLSDTSWTEWSEPVNLGKQINTSGDDLGYKISISGDLVYFSTSEDIYSVTLPGTIRPEIVITVSGTVKDEKGNYLEAEIKWEDLESGENVGTLRSNPQDGTYFIPLPAGKKYGYYAEKEGYYPISNNIDLITIKEPTNVKVDIILVTAEAIVDTTITITNIFFDFDKYELKRESYPELNRLTDFLNDYSQWKVEIMGHTDSKGTNEYNKILSEKRAQAVVDYLVSKGIDKSRIITKGYGEERPVASNDTEEGREKNRRVEFQFINK